MNLSAQVTDISVQDTLPPARPDSLQVDSLGAGPTAGGNVKR